jgi:hypothetical protein
LKLNRRVLKFKELEKEVKNAIKKVKKSNYKNYFEYTYGKKLEYKPRGRSTLHRNPRYIKSKASL